MENNLISLYDYLGYAAGTALGENVYKTAKKLKENMETREVSNTRYKGKVMLYRKEFLEEYFRLKQEAEYEPALGDRQDYFL
jgi:hypothetical protein